ncbi:MAG: thioesterase family protein [bacterium]
MELEPGLEAEITITVGEDDLATAFGNEGVPVFATPALLSYFESTCRKAVEGALPEGSLTVGTWAEMKHMAATPPGMKVTFKARLTEVDRRRLLFEVEAHDEAEKIGEGNHERYYLDAAKFLEKAKEKAGSKE